MYFTVFLNKDDDDDDDMMMLMLIMMMMMMATFGLLQSYRKSYLPRPKGATGHAALGIFV